jgi:CrcB protein
LEKIKGKEMTLIYIAIGGAIGSVLRYLMMVKTTAIMGVNFPYGTMVVNIIGSFCMGLLIGYLSKTLPHSMEWRAFLAIGVLGGFTTFSSFSLDVVTLIERSQIAQAATYSIASVVISVIALFAGLHIFRT